MSRYDKQIENRNFLSPTGFKFTLNRSPKVSFFCNSANIPALNLGVAVQPNYNTNVPIPGDKVEFDDLRLRFLIDENLENFMESLIHANPQFLFVFNAKTRSKFPLVWPVPMQAHIGHS